MIPIGIALYSLAALAVARPIAGHQAWKISDSYTQTKPDGSDWFIGWVVGFFAGVVWPICGLLVLVLRFTPKMGAEARAVARQREAHIAELEKELELR
jgi:hypothetical protein